MRHPLATSALVFLLLAGCVGIGPGTVLRDRLDYNNAIANSWKEQTLLNIVKLRYSDMPLFVEVASVVSGYTMESAVDLGVKFFELSAPPGDELTLGGSGKYTDRPTITYTPITGEKFNTSFMTPIPPKSILFLLQSGWPADIVFPIAVNAINGLRSRIGAGAKQRTGDPDYYRLVALMRELQKSGALSMRIVKGEKDAETTIMSFQRKDIAPEIAAAIREINALLGLDPNRKETIVTYGLFPDNDRGISMLTNSTLQIMIELASQVDAPLEHVADGRALPALPPLTDGTKEISRLIQIKSAPQLPEHAFTAVRYENHWFWIDKRDYRSKRTFAILMLLFSLTETGGREGLPLVTIPAG